ncbi:MAG: cell division protein CrgA [Micrococcaceae bacterium]
MPKEKNERRKLMRLAKNPLRDTKDIAFEGLDENPKWLKPAMFAALLLGFAWLIIYTLSDGLYPVVAWGGYNIFIGFALVILGFILATQWK